MCRLNACEAYVGRCMFTTCPFEATFLTNKGRSTSSKLTYRACTPLGMSSAALTCTKVVARYRFPTIIYMTFA